MCILGWSGKSAKTRKFLTEKFPHRLDLKNELGVAYLMYGKNEEARQAFQQVSRYIIIWIG